LNEANIVKQNIINNERIYIVSKIEILYGLDYFSD